MGNSDDHDLFAAIGIYDAEGKTTKKRLSEFPTNGRTDSKTFQHRLNCALDVIEKRVSQSRDRRLVKGGGLVHVFPRQGKIAMADHFRRLRASAITSSPGIASTSPRRYWA